MGPFDFEIVFHFSLHRVFSPTQIPKRVGLTIDDTELLPMCVMTKTVGGVSTSEYSLSYEYIPLVIAATDVCMCVQKSRRSVYNLGHQYFVDIIVSLED